MRHIGDDDMVLHYYGDGDDRRAVEEHLAACDECRERFAGLSKDMGALMTDHVPERGEAYGAEVWARIAPRLEPAAGRQAGGQGFLAWFTWPRLAMAGAVAMLVVSAFVAGRYWQPAAVHAPAPTVAQAPPAIVKERILLVAVGEHLERSKVILAEISNRDGTAPIDLGPERARAEDLVATNRLYRQAAASMGDPAMAATLEALERILAEIANGPETTSATDLAGLRERIESQGLLFKVTVLGSQVQQRQRQAVSPVASRTGA